MADQPTQPTLGRASAAEEPAPAAGRPSERADRPDRRSMVRRTASVGRRWARDNFSREQVISGLKSLAWVAPLTLLVWIYAERAQQDDGTTTVQVDVKSADPGRIARLVSRDRTVTAILKGPKAGLDEAARRFDVRVGMPVQVFVEGNRPPGTYEIDVLAQVQKDQRFTDNGISVTEVQPRLITVEVDALQEEDLEVRPQAELQHRLNRYSFEPKKVRVAAPAKVLAQVRTKGPLYAQVDLSGFPEINTPGTHGPLRAPVTVPALGDAALRVWPPNVTATLDVKPADVQYVIDSLPVSKDIVGDVDERHKIVFQTKFIPSVAVYGPAEKIKQLEAKTLTPIPQARFKVTPLDIGAGKITRELEYALPEGIRLREGGAPKMIEFEVVPRDGT
jgi:hypothetical protein